MIDPILEGRILRVMEIIHPGWTFSIGKIHGSEDEVFVLGFPIVNSEWAMMDCTFDEAIENAVMILESYRWN